MASFQIFDFQWMSLDSENENVYYLEHREQRKTVLHFNSFVKKVSNKIRSLTAADVFRIFISSYTNLQTITHLARNI